MSTPLETIYLLEEKLNNLLYKYQFLKEENQILLENHAKLHHLLQEKIEELEMKQQEYNLLKIAKTIQGSKENTKETKQKINTLVREIDKCISLLNS